MGIYRKSQARKRAKRRQAFQRRAEGWAVGRLRALDREFRERLRREP